MPVSCFQSLAVFQRDVSRALPRLLSLATGSDVPMDKGGPIWHEGSLAYPGIVCLIAGEVPAGQSTFWSGG